MLDEGWTYTLQKEGWPWSGAKLGVTDLIHKGPFCFANLDVSTHIGEVVVIVFKTGLKS